MAGNAKVYKKLLRGEPVHFDAEKQAEKERQVPAEWVAKALREGHRVKLKDAILTGPLNLPSAHVEQEFILVGGEVRGPVNAFYARFARWVAFNAVRFHDSVSFKGARLAAELNCAGTHFFKGVTFEDSMVEGSFVAGGAQFGSSEEDTAGFNGCEISRAANFSKTVFHGPAQFINLIVAKQATFNGARFEQEVAFSQAEISGSFFFRPAGDQRVAFGGAASFRGVKVSGQADFSGARFKQRVAFDRAEIGGAFFFRPEGGQRVDFGGEARFVGVKVSGPADFSGARFEQGVAFDRAEIGGSFFFRPEGDQRVEFGGEARFHGFKVGGQANFNGARFKDEVYFQGAAVEGETVFVGVEFQKEVSFQRAEFKAGLYFSQPQRPPTTFGGEAQFHGVKVGGQANFSGARFEEKAAFDRAEIGGSFFFSPEGEQRVEFGGEAQFHGVKVGGQADFRGARFKQLAAFDGAEIGSDFFFRPQGEQRVEFGGEARFTGVKVGGQADFSGAQFEQEAGFEGAVFSDRPFFQEANFSAPVSFVTARFQLAAEFQGAQFHGPVYFDYARFEQEAHFAGAKFGDQLKLRDARMTTLSFLEEEEEKEKTVAVFHPDFKVDLLGCAYDRLEIDDWRKLMDRQSEFNPRPWSHLEKVLRGAGHKGQADDVYFNRRKQERRLLPWNRWVRRLADILEWVFAGYGVRNGRVMLSILALLLLGTVVFQLPGVVVPASEHLAVPEEGGLLHRRKRLNWIGFLLWVSASSNSCRSRSLCCGGTSPPRDGRHSTHPCTCFSESSLSPRPLPPSAV